MYKKYIGPIIKIMNTQVRKEDTFNIKRMKYINLFVLSFMEKTKNCNHISCPT